MEGFFRFVSSLFGETVLERTGFAVRKAFLWLIGRPFNIKKPRKVTQDYFYINDSTVNIVVGAITLTIVLFVFVMLVFK